MSASTDAYVTLKGGLVVPLPALQVAWGLEDRGFDLHLADDGALLVSPRDAITDEDRAVIRRWKLHLAALVAYCDREGWTQ